MGCRSALVTGAGAVARRETRQIFRATRPPWAERPSRGFILLRARLQGRTHQGRCRQGSRGTGTDRSVAFGQQGATLCAGCARSQAFSEALALGLRLRGSATPRPGVGCRSAALPCGILFRPEEAVKALACSSSFSFGMRRFPVFSPHPCARDDLALAAGARWRSLSSPCGRALGRDASGAPAGR